MANQTTIIRITSAKPASAWPINLPADQAHSECTRLAELFERLGSGFDAGNIEVQVGGTASAYATGTATLSSVVATDAITINGVAFAVVNSGATGNQVNKGANDTATAANFAAKINASSTAKISKYVKATSAGAVLTITAYAPGLLGNLITIAQTGNHITLNPASALAGGAGADVPATTYVRS